MPPDDRTIIEGYSPEEEPVKGGASSVAPEGATIIEGAGGGPVDSTIIEGTQARAEANINLSPGGSFLEYALQKPLEVTSGEADLWFIQDQSGQEHVLKYYRYGIVPKEEITEKLRGMETDCVVRILATGEVSGRHYEVLEKIEHGDLVQYLGGQALGDMQVKAVVKGLGFAIAHLHHAGILHRDIKPANILVRTLEPLDLVVTDFGISSLSDAALHMTTVNRTASYCAPEAMQGVVARASDWWSMGVIILEMLKGVHPFTGMNEQAVNFQLVAKGIEVPEDIPEEWQLLLKGLLTRDPDLRWGWDEIHAWLDGRRDLTVQYQYGATSQATHKPYKFGDKEYLDPKDLAVAMGEEWELGKQHLGRGMIVGWVDGQLSDQNLSVQLHEITEDEKLDPDQKLSSALMVLNPDMPLVRKGTVINQDWMIKNAVEAVALLEGPLPGQCVKLCSDSWLVEMRDRRTQCRAQIQALGVQINMDKMDELLMQGDSELIRQIQEVRTKYFYEGQFAGATDGKIEEYLTKEDLSLTEGLALLCCDESVFMSAEEKQQQESMEYIKGIGVGIDEQLAKQLVTANNWDSITPRWQEVMQDPQTPQLLASLNNQALNATYASQQPEYQDVVRLVCALSREKIRAGIAKHQHEIKVESESVQVRGKRSKYASKVFYAIGYGMIFISIKLAAKSEGIETYTFGELYSVPLILGIFGILFLIGTWYYERRSKELEKKQQELGKKTTALGQYQEQALSDKDLRRDQVQYFLLREGEQHGPYDLEVAHAFSQDKDFAWCEGMDGWMPAAVVLRIEESSAPPELEPSQKENSDYPENAVTRTYKSTMEELMSVSFISIRDLGYSDIVQDEEGGSISFKTGRSWRSFAGQVMLLRLESNGSGMVSVHISGKLDPKGPSALTDWGEAKTIANKVFDGIERLI